MHCDVDTPCLLMKKSILTKSQKKTVGPVSFVENGRDLEIIAKLRYDDECGNGHNSFSITGIVRTANRGQEEIGGCIHEEIAAHFPELKHLIKWHFMSSDGPRYYIANTMYNAGNKDYNGKSKGEPRAFKKFAKFGGFPITRELEDDFASFIQSHKVDTLQIVPIEHKKDDYDFGDKFTFKGYTDVWHECPFNNEREAQEFLQALQSYKLEVVDLPYLWGTGKERDLEAARNSAVWADATDEELTSDGLKQRLEKRLPCLIKEFAKDMESLGFTF